MDARDRARKRARFRRRWRAGRRSGVEQYIDTRRVGSVGHLGASRERVNKAIASFVKLGWIDQADRSYTILDRQQLEIRAS